MMKFIFWGPSFFFPFYFFNVRKVVLITKKIPTLKIKSAKINSTIKIINFILSQTWLFMFGAKLVASLEKRVTLEMVKNAI